METSLPPSGAPTSTLSSTVSSMPGCPVLQPATPLRSGSGKLSANENPPSKGPNSACAAVAERTISPLNWSGVPLDEPVGSSFAPRGARHHRTPMSLIAQGGADSWSRPGQQVLDSTHVLSASQLHPRARMRRVFFWVSALCFIGCERAAPRPIVGDLEVSPRSIDFGPVFVGAQLELPVVLHNRSRAERVLSVTSTGPFSSADQVVVSGGSELSVQLRFAPGAPGEATGVLVIRDATAVFEIALVGIGVELPQCSPSAACQVSLFDQALGLCVENQAEDGTSCSNACITGGRCTSGRCVGLAMNCVDADLCTVDACDPTSGCLHLARACLAPNDPCKAARCDPALGCVENDVRDGTSCGAADCVTAQICLQGQCKALPVPDGAACSPATPCQGAGSCRQGLCERPAATTLVEAWNYDFPGMTFSFRGVTDALQNLYWMECGSSGPCAAISYTREGVLRFRTQLAFAALDSNELHYLLAGDEVILANGTSIQAVAISDGSPRWAFGLPAALPGAPDVADTQTIHAMAADQTGLTLMVARSLGTQESRQSLVLKLNLGTRSTVFARFYGAQVGGAVIDEFNNLYLSLVPWYQPGMPTRPQSLVSLRATGVERWRWVAPLATPYAVQKPIAVFNGEVITEGGEVRSAQDGSLRAAAPAGEIQNNPLMGPSARILLRRPVSMFAVEAIAMSPGGATQTWAAEVITLHGSNSITDTVASASGGLLVAAGGSRQATMLKSFDGLGAERFSCQVPGNVPGGSMVHLPVALLDGRWAVVESRYMVPAQLRVFEVPGERPATRGWLSRYGSPSGNRHPVP